MALFEAARAEGRLADLDLVCARAAVDGALDGRLHAPATLFVNAEPEAMSHDATQLAARAAGTSLPIVVEITERALTARPAEPLEAVDRLRAAGFGIALDDVGADERSLACFRSCVPTSSSSTSHSSTATRAGSPARC